jgi:DNA-binding transcriptional regulator YhcF (GntR family)
MLQKKTLKEKIKEEMQTLILREKLKVGERFFSEKKLSEHFEVSHMTIRAALALLAEDGTVEQVPGSGTYIRKLPNRKKANAKSSGWSIQGTPDDKLVALLIRSTGHLYSDFTEIISAKLQEAGFIPLLISTGSYDPFFAEGVMPEALFEQLDNAYRLGCRKLLAATNSLYWEEPHCNRLGVSNKKFSRWEKIVWFGGGAGIPDHIMGDVVEFDTRKTMAETVGYLRESGYKKIAFVTHKENPARRYMEGGARQIVEFSVAMTNAGIPDGIMILTEGRNDEANFKQMYELLSSANRPEVIFGASDHRLIKVFQIAETLGIRIPEDLALVGCNNTPWAKHYGMTSINYDLKYTADQLLNLLGDDRPLDSEKKLIKVTPELIERGSSSLALKEEVLYNYI